MSKVLFVLTSHDQLLNGKPTGWYLPEAAHPYHVLNKAGLQVDFASPKGGAAPLDPTSVEAFKEDKEATAFLNGEKEQKLVKNTLKLSDVKPDDYAAIFYVGGHGPCFDLVNDSTSISLIEKFYAAGKPTGAVCHGPVVFSKAKGPDGKPLVNGRKVTCFSNAEEEAAGLTKEIPFLVETDLREKGADFKNDRENWGVEVYTDTNGGILITGANPASATKTGEALLKAIQGKN